MSVGYNRFRADEAAMTNRESEKQRKSITFSLLRVRTTARRFLGTHRLQPSPIPQPLTALEVGSQRKQWSLGIVAAQCCYQRNRVFD